MSTRLALGAPGIYRMPDTPLRSLAGARMDVCAFLGVAPRGPARVPLVDEVWPDDRPTVEPGRPRLRSVAVPVESWDEYRQIYGGFEGPGLLPYAVASFFEQGGRRAYVVRIVHDYADPLKDAAGVATGTLAGVRRPGGGAVSLSARNEGAWGNRLRAAMSFRAAPLVLDAPSSTVSELRLPPGVKVPLGSLLRCSLGAGARVLRFAAQVAEEWEVGTRRRRAVVTLDAPLPSPAERVEVVEGALDVDDRDGRRERLEGLGLSAEHPRWAATVICNESALVFPAEDWAADALVPDSLLLAGAPAPEGQFSGGADRSADIVPGDFFDDGWVPGDEDPRSGVHALVDIEEVSLVVAADLYSPRPLDPDGGVSDAPAPASAVFEPCGGAEQAPPAKEPKPPALDGLHLDPTQKDDLEKIVGHQARLVDLARQLASFIVLLDVPPGLNQRQILAWRARFSTAYAAAYHPWALVSRADDARSSLIRVNPSAVAAGIVAAREIRLGVPFGPANEIAKGVVGVEEEVSRARHDELHQAGINVLAREPGGVRLTAARTLSSDPSYRQLSVRRLVTQLKRVLAEQMHWMAFEPNSPSLRATVRHLLRGYLRQLYTASAFEGRTEDEAFFVRCDEALNPPQVVEAGRLICEIGVAPAEPLEFLVLRLDRGGDGTLRVEG